MIIRLLTIFAQQLGAMSNQLLIRQTSAELPAITKVRSYIAENLSEELHLHDVARSANMSSFYFCKLFKRTTGLTFTTYLARLRIEAVKQKLLNVHTRVSEAAYATRFQSLSQFNRVFRHVAGESSTDYRSRLHGFSQPRSSPLV
jgi:AraC-like DNA-binding protein